MAVATTTGEVLLVEDDLSIRDMLHDLLEDEGYRVRSAGNGRDALACLRASGPTRLILLDLMMPVMDGWAFREAQRRDPALSHIPVIVLSADDALAEKALRMSAAAWLSKPFELGVLLDAIHRHALPKAWPYLRCAAR
jgi:CheY-like chemotaxis protein